MSIKSIPPEPSHGETGGVTLRRAVRADLPAIVAMLADDPLGATRETPADLAPYARAFAAIDADPNHLLLVADDGGQVVGTLQLTILPGLSRGAALRGQIEAVRVARSHRSTGLGTAMFEHAFEEGRQRGCTLVQLTSDRERPDAHRFYDRLGFTASHFGYKKPL